jgi:transcriptional activator HAC1
MVVERRNQDLEMRLAAMEAHNAVLLDEVKRLGGNSNMHFFQGSSSPDQIRSSPTPVTFSQQLFTSQDEDNRPISTQSIHGSPLQTVNPASLSPEIRPVAESTNASSSDMTQHPAAMLCDLQCQSEEQRPWMDSTSTASAISQILATTLLVTMISEVTSTLLSPLSQIMHSLSNGSPLSPTTSILTLIIWLTTTTASLRTSTSTTSSTTTSNPRNPRFTLRIRLLRRLLTCSPNLARPLMDATVVAMRSASEQQLSSVACLPLSRNVNRIGKEGPGIEVLTTLLWAIQCFENERKQKLMTDEMDASSEVRQACEELSVLFSPRVLSRKKRNVFGEVHGRGTGLETQKSLEGWRTEFKH